MPLVYYHGGLQYMSCPSDVYCLQLQHCMLTSNSMEDQSVTAFCWCVQEIHFVDIGDAALLAIVASLKEQAGRLCVPVQENPNLGSILQQLRKSENGYGMRWGIHDNRIGKDITYSVSLNCQRSPP